MGRCTGLHERYAGLLHTILAYSNGLAPEAKTEAKIWSNEYIHEWSYVSFAGC